MAFSPTDPASEHPAHSLWLQLRHTNRTRPRWRSDWTPLWISLLLFSVLAIFYVMMPSNEAVEQAAQAAQQETVIQGRPVQGALAEP